MANEITLNAVLQYADSETASIVLGIPANTQKTITTKKFVYNKMAVTTSELAVPLGNLTTLGHFLFINRDTTNFVEIRVSTGSTKAWKLLASNGFAMGYFGSGVTAPYIVADTASCQVEYLILAI